MSSCRKQSDTSSKCIRNSASTQCCDGQRSYLFHGYRICRGIRSSLHSLGEAKIWMFLQHGRKNRKNYGRRISGNSKNKLFIPTMFDVSLIVLTPLVNMSI